MRLEQIGPFIFIVVTLIFIIVLMIGSRWNQRLLREAWDRVAHSLAPHSEKIGGRIGHNLFRMMAFPKKEAPFRKVNVIMSTMDRENAFHYILRYFHTDEDLLMFQGDVRDLRTVPTLELVPITAKILEGRVKVRRPETSEMIEFSTKDFGYTSEFLVFTKDREFARYVLRKKEVQDTVEHSADTLDRVSISEDSPNILVTCKAQLPNIPQSTALFQTLGKRVHRYVRSSI
ncbi:MAG: hypothetical protein ACE5R6_05890 [Candidatus Heimdallarchaeota archaeon]